MGFSLGFAAGAANKTLREMMALRFQEEMEKRRMAQEEEWRAAQIAEQKRLAERQERLDARQEDADAVARIKDSTVLGDQISPEQAELLARAGYGNLRTGGATLPSTAMAGEPSLGQLITQKSESVEDPSIPFTYMGTAGERETRRREGVAQEEQKRREGVASAEARETRYQNRLERDEQRAWQTERDKENRAHQTALQRTALGAAATARREAEQRREDEKEEEEKAKRAVDLREADEALDLVDNIEDHPAFSSAVGPTVPGAVARLNPEVRHFHNLHSQFVGKLKLAARGKLKGQGQISDSEQRILSEAVTALETGLSEKRYREELARARKILDKLVLPTDVRSELEGAEDGTYEGSDGTRWIVRRGRIRRFGG